ncbi:MAG: hypothetical protein JNL83_27260 [Myxococcales bacterium]|nr:hypothetical protein [Myxococcales bacterium]
MRLALALVLAFGCSNDEFDTMLDQLAVFRDQACACADVACADKALADWRAYRNRAMAQVAKDARPSEKQERRGRALEDDLRRCREKLDAK